MLELKDVSTYYGQFLVLRNVSLNVSPGEIVTVMGPNGAGKTTLLRTISGMVNPRAGSIIFNGTEISKLKPHEVSRLGLVHVPEGRQIFPDLSVMENLRVASAITHARKNREETYKLVFDVFPILKERASQKAGTLSGGERQMLCAAMGIMNCPKLLMIDEPSQGLAPKLVLDLFGKIKEMCECYNIAILLVEQQTSLALELATRGYLLVNGEIALQGSARELIENEEVKKHYLAL
jgi:branched-chain amino acid transport system ATP-binding protein